MSQYLFIDIVVYEKVCECFVCGEVFVVFSEDLLVVFWVNGVGVCMFGNVLIYDFIDQGLDICDFVWWQMMMIVGQFGVLFGLCSFFMCVVFGFECIIVQVSVEKIVVGNEMVVLFVVFMGVCFNVVCDVVCWLIEGFDDLEMYVVVIGESGEVLLLMLGFSEFVLFFYVVFMLQGGVCGKFGYVLKCLIYIGDVVYLVVIV